MTTKIIMPVGSLIGADRQLTPAARAYLAAIGNRVTNKPATTAAELLAGASTLVEAQAIWDALVTDKSSGAGHWSPDLAVKLDFWRTITGATVIDYPLHPFANAALFYSVRVIMDGNGGWPVTFGDGFEGEEPVILDGANDITMLGFQVTGPASFTAWAIKGIEFAA